jgi:hypothetical protein
MRRRRSSRKCCDRVLADTFAPIRLLAPGLRHQGANNKANCDTGPNAESKVADREANYASDRYAKTNPNAHEFAIFFVG